MEIRQWKIEHWPTATTLSLGLIIEAPWISVPNVVAVDSIVLDIFQSGFKWSYGFKTSYILLE